MSGSIRDAVDRFMMDAARWVRPQEIVPVSTLSGRVIAKLLVRHPPLRAMAWFRLASALASSGVRGVPSWIQRRLLRLYGLELTPGTPIGGGLYIAHPVGCVLVAEDIGTNVTIIGQVTFGTRTDNRWPIVGDDTFFGVGARVLGGITVGAAARIGANAVVLDDVAAGATAVGNPAETVRTRTATR